MPLSVRHVLNNTALVQSSALPTNTYITYKYYKHCINGTTQTPGASLAHIYSMLRQNLMALRRIRANIAYIPNKTLKDKSNVNTFSSID